MRFKLFIENEDWWQNFLKTIKGPNINWPLSSHDIYDALTTRGQRSNLDNEYSKLNLTAREKDYTEVVNNLIDKLKSKNFITSNKSTEWDGTGNNISDWVHVKIPTEVNWGTNYQEAPIHAFKTYRTFVPNQNNRISNFLNSLVGFAEVLKDLQNADPNYPDRIQFKFLRNLRDFFNHTDSLVVHWRNRYNRERINQAIDNYFKSQNVQFADRGARATQGYDMINQGAFKGGSHSQLIGYALHKLISKYPQVRQASDENLKEWLGKWIDHFNKLSPVDLFNYLNSE